MKILKSTLFTILLVWLIACQGRQHEARTQMMLDSDVSGSNVSLVKPKQAVRPDESVSDLKGLNNIMQYDLEAKERTPSNEVMYVKLGEPARPTEQRK